MLVKLGSSMGTTRTDRIRNEHQRDSTGGTLWRGPGARLRWFGHVLRDSEYIGKEREDMEMFV